MKIEYKNKKIEKICTDATTAEKQYGNKIAEKIHLRVDQISASNTVEEMMQFKVGRCHKLTNNRSNQYAVDLVHPLRLVFEKKEDTIQIAKIIEIVDYH